MAYNKLLLALGLVAAALPASLAAQPDTDPIALTAAGIAPAGDPGTRYCMRVDPITGSLIETVQCWTRDEWADQGVDVDKEWARNGVKLAPPVMA
jgi:hypothetical protein